MSLNNHKEGETTKAIEKQTSKLPSDAFLGVAIGAMALSLALRVAGKNSASTFVGQWAAPILIMGVYNKLVKQHGHDQEDTRVSEKREKSAAAY
ncbi:MAG TPA: hypothetical protein VFF27_07430 [Bacteroidia bacterium]|nr:hypothetical protein [Bacteroidia bacterium]